MMSNETEWRRLENKIDKLFDSLKEDIEKDIKDYFEKDSKDLIEDNEDDDFLFLDRSHGARHCQYPDDEYYCGDWLYSPKDGTFHKDFDEWEFRLPFDTD